MAGYRVLSSDSHVYEPPDLWTSRIESRFRHRAPHIAHLEDGDWWVCDGLKGQDLASGAQAGRRFEAPETLTMTDVFENVRPGGYIPAEHVKDMDADGVDVDVLYPTAGLVLFRVPDSELADSIFSIYNTWLAEFCNAYPKRLKGIAMINLDDIRAGVGELERCARMGLVGAMISVAPPPGRSYDSPEYEPFWAAAQDLQAPLSLHVGTARPVHSKDAGGGPSEPGTHDLLQSAAYRCNVDPHVRMSIAHMIYAGVFERYPKLQVGSVEHDLSWAAHFLHRLDFVYTQVPQRDNWHRFDEDMLPSDYFRRNVFLSFQEDAVGIRLRDIIGVDNLLWSSDYPHTEGTFPRSQQILEEILADCTEEEKAKIAGGNAARIYNLD